MPSENNLASTNSDGFIGRLFSAPTIFYGKPLALGRNHASWFLVFAHPYGAQMIRTAMCVNFLVPNDARCVSAGPADSSPGSGAASVRPRFVVGGTQGLEALNTLSALRDKVGRKPVAVVQTFEDAERDPMGVQAIVEVLVPEDELIRACARCGRWEAEARPRFRRCGGCKSRYYCSREVR
ncbi:hypothetical protein C2E23DRAFT_41021 [Lenzites betulinus]|nr:hypothetical protein C2E23DRAFT_41021 [Lenzites betulinus]